ncbi:hypothetical protein LINPERHAP2_LOCUS38181 [Linum perenne]
MHVANVRASLVRRHPRAVAATDFSSLSRRHRSL